jgi:hypothetical protein
MEPTPGPAHRRVYMQGNPDANGKRIVHVEVDERGLVEATAEAMDWLLRLAGFVLTTTGDEHKREHPQEKAAE